MKIKFSKAVLIFIITSQLTALLSCKKGDDRTIRILNSCIDIDRKTLQVNESFIIKNCGDGPNALIEVIGIENPELERRFNLDSKTDSATIIFFQSGTYEAKLRSTGTQIGDYSDWARDTIIVLD